MPDCQEIDAAVPRMLVTQSCLTLRNPMDCIPPGFSVCGISQARILEWLPFPSPEDFPDPGIEPWSPTFQVDSLLPEPPGRPINVYLLKNKADTYNTYSYVSYILS